MPKQKAPLPEWCVKLAYFAPRFPGDGFNHSVNSINAVATIQCPCGMEFRESLLPYIDGEAIVAVCPQCSHWHSVLLFTPAPVLGGSFILAGTNQT